MDSETTMRLIYLSLLAVAIGGWALAEMRCRIGQSLRYLLVWGMIAMGLIAGFGLWNDVQSGLMGAKQSSDEGSITLPRAQDGHFYAELTINNKAIRFLIDTGATAMVLTKQDVASLGIDPEALNFDGEAFTANGSVSTAEVVLDQVSFGPYTDIGFAADVNDGDLAISLLGMTYLSLYRFSVTGDEMILSR